MTVYMLDAELGIMEVEVQSFEDAKERYNYVYASQEEAQREYMSVGMVCDDAF